MRKVLFAFGLTSLLVVFAAGCEFIDVGGGGSQASAYAYTAYDSTDSPVVRGTLWLNYVETGSDVEHPYQVEGHWRLQKVVAEAEVGPQTGTGRLRGLIDEEGTVRIDLNPNFDDNNVILRGAFTEEQLGDIAGEWTHHTFAGVARGGTFEAMQ